MIAEIEKRLRDVRIALCRESITAEKKWMDRPTSDNRLVLELKRGTILGVDTALMVIDEEKQERWLD